jgi:hypothetical protein
MLAMCDCLAEGLSQPAAHDEVAVEYRRGGGKVSQQEREELCGGVEERRWGRGEGRNYVMGKIRLSPEADLARSPAPSWQPQLAVKQN